MSNFLDGLKNSLDKGEFNSESAKKIMEITELSKEKKGDVEKYLENNKALPIDEKEALIANKLAKLEELRIKRESRVLSNFADIENLEDALFNAYNNLESKLEMLKSSDLFEEPENLNEQENKLLELVNTPINIIKIIENRI